MPYRTRLTLFSPDGSGGWADPVELVRMELERPSFSPVGSDDCDFQVARPPVFTSEAVFDVARNRVAYNAWVEYRVDVTSFDGRRMSVRRALSLVRATRELAAREIGPVSFEMNGVFCDQSGEERAGQAGWPLAVPGRVGSS